MHLDIGVRMKEYESLPTTSKGVNVLRLDGKAFHTWTKKIKATKPFSNIVMHCMAEATEYLAREIQGCKIAYTQSDEATFLIANLEPNSEAWFGGKQQKIVSVASSIFTYAFNKCYGDLVDKYSYPNVPAFFDARAHSIPVEDAANNIIWRQLDWRRNSVQMLGQHYLGHRLMQKLSNEEVIDSLKKGFGIDWEELHGPMRHGTFVLKTDLGNIGFHQHSAYLNYEQIIKKTGLEDYI